MKIIKEQAIPPIYVTPDDMVILTYTDKDGVATEVLSAKVDVTETFDTAVIFKLENEMGFAAGLGGIFGRKQK